MNQRLKLSLTLRLLLWIWAWGSALLFCGCEENRPVKIGELSPEIMAKDIYGRGVSMEQLKGRIVLIYFWTNSCCGNSLKDLQGLYDRNKDRGVAVVAINEIDATGDVHSYAKNNALTFTMLADEHFTIFKRYQGMGFPTIFILDRKGVIREKILGKVPVAKLEELVQRQLQIEREAETSYEKLHRR